MKPANRLSAPAPPPALTQVGALPIRFEKGEAQALLLTSRETRRWVIPKGWPMKGRKNWAAAAREAREEAGVIGRMEKRPVGSFLYFKRRAAHFDLVRVEVYVLHYEKRLDAYREKGQREARWFALDQAAEEIEETGLAALLRDLNLEALAKPRRKIKGAKKNR